MTKKGAKRQMDTMVDYDKPMEQVLYEVKKTIVGQDVLLERL